MTFINIRGFERKLQSRFLTPIRLKVSEPVTVIKPTRNILLNPY